MNGGWRYRLLSVAGTAALAAVAVGVANHAVVQRLFQLLPVVGHLPFDSAVGREFVIEASIATIVVCAALFPLYKPRPQRILDTIVVVQRRTLIAIVTLSAIGYFDYTYRLPRSTVMLIAPLLLAALPAWFVAIRRRPTDDGSRALIVGDDPDTMREIIETDLPIIGYVSPAIMTESPETGPPLVMDGGAHRSVPFERLGGLSRLDEVLVDHDIDTVVLAFEWADRDEFFGAIDACREHGVTTKVHREHADAVLTADEPTEPLVDVEIEPWDIQDHIIKRGFDVLFAGTALLLLAPIILLIAAAIVIEGNGPVLFSQKRTYLFGETFTVHKFRTLKPDPTGEGNVGTTFDGDRQTLLGEFLRTTHLDEIPQLWAILVGDMSVVGPRPAQTEIEGDFEAEADQWRQRWFVKPGLTGLAQINGASSQNPRAKIHYDLQYIRNQSFWYDLKIVARQVWQVVVDVLSLATDRDDAKQE